MFSGTDEQLIASLRVIEASRASNEVRAIAGAAADRIEAMAAALRLWLTYNDSDDSSVNEMLMYADALEATRAIFKKD
jgi:two-component sensor histidine kinase